LYAVVLAVFLASAGVASAQRVIAGKLIIDYDVRLVPKANVKKASVRKRFIPVAYTFSADLHMKDGSLPPSATHVVFDFDRNVRVTNIGLPSCPPSALTGATVAAARATCKNAMVGTGSIGYTVAEPGKPAVSATSQITAFNGDSSFTGGSFYVHAFLPVPTPTSYVVPVIVSRINEGVYKLRVAADPPPIAGGHGTITHFDITVQRQYRVGKQRRSYASVRCARGGFIAHGQGLFDDGTLADGLTFVPCRAKKGKK
jgi:hypothetical protein